MAEYGVRKFLIDKRARGSPETQEILDRLGGTALEETAKRAAAPGSREGNVSRTAMGKDFLHLLPYRGAFLKPCPGTRRYICCGYQILNIGTGCPLDCSYCILQAYFKDQPGLRVFVNLKEGIEGVMNVIDSAPRRIFRVGTGEFTDSLALDPVTRWSDLIIPKFSTRKNSVLELKTKTTQIDGPLRSRYRERIIISWSLNSPSIASGEERKAAGLRKRLEAAARCQSEGFVLGFHFDPLFHYPGWREDYLRSVEMLDRYIDPAGIIWISLGAFRFMPELKPIIRKRHPASRVLDGEFVPGLDGKLRYFKPIRIELYGYMNEILEKWSQDLGLYLCMESDEVWRKGMGWSPGDNAGLSRYLDQRVIKVFGGIP